MQKVHIMEPMAYGWIQWLMRGSRLGRGKRELRRNGCNETGLEVVIWISAVMLSHGPSQIPVTSKRLWLTHLGWSVAKWLWGIRPGWLTWVGWLLADVGWPWLHVVFTGQQASSGLCPYGQEHQEYPVETHKVS